MAVADVEGVVFLWDRLLEAWNQVRVTLWLHEDMLLARLTLASQVPRRHRRTPSVEELQAQFEKFALETLPTLSVPGVHRCPSPDAGFTHLYRIRRMLERIEGALPTLEEIRAAARH
jgi:hypothetical protein